MAENTPNLPEGAVPPKPAEVKVQPKKETVRISLPPKPTASPTIKLPTLPAAAPAAAAPAAVPPPPPAAASAPASGLAPASAAIKPATGSPGAKLSGVSAPKAAAAPAAPAQKASAAPQKAVAHKPAATVGTFDKVLAVLALVANLVAVGCMIFLMMLLDKTQELIDAVPK